MIKLVISDAVKPHRRARSHQEIERGAHKARASAKGASKPPAAIGSLLTNVTRTNPQVALGSSCRKLQISPAVRSPVMGHAQNFCPLQGQQLRSDSAESIKGNLAIPDKALVRAAFIRDALKRATRNFQALPRQGEGLCEMSDDLALFFELAGGICCISHSLFSS
jgi:hypothetical protein